MQLYRRAYTTKINNMNPTIIISRSILAPLAILVFILILALQQFSSKRTAQAFFTFGSFFAVDQYLSQLCAEDFIDYKSWNGGWYVGSLAHPGRIITMFWLYWTGSPTHFIEGRGIWLGCTQSVKAVNLSLCLLLLTWMEEPRMSVFIAIYCECNTSSHFEISRYYNLQPYFKNIF